MSRQAIWAIALLVGAVAIAAVMIALRPEPEEQEVVATVPLVETVAYTVSEGSLEIFGTGTVQPREEAVLSAEVGGRLTFVSPAFREGGTVGRGSVLFRIDPSDYQNRVRSAQADVAAQDVAVLQAEQEVAIADAELRRFAGREGTRTTAAQTIDDNDYAARILPPEGLARSTASRTGASDTGVLATREPQLRSSRAARDRASAQLADARLALSRTTVRAPFGGLIRSEAVAPGLLVQPGQNLGSIVATDSFDVRVSLTEGEAALIPALFEAGRARIPATVTLDYGDASYSWDAYVDRADAILDPETRTIDVFLRVPNPLRGGKLAGGTADAGAAPPLLVGSFVEAAIIAGSARPFAAIPIEALRTDDQVWLLANGKLRIVDVEVIQRTDTTAYVAGAGLGQGGRIVTSALRTPVDGMALRSAANAGDSAGANAGAKAGE